MMKYCCPTELSSIFLGVLDAFGKILEENPA